MRCARAVIASLERPCSRAAWSHVVQLVSNASSTYSRHSGASASSAAVGSGAACTCASAAVYAEQRSASIRHSARACAVLSDAAIHAARPA